MSRTILAIVVTALGSVATARAEGDATQSIDSPLAPGSGVTLTASQSKTALTLGIQQHFAKTFDWNAAIEGVVNDSDTLTIFSRSAGGGPGTTLRLGVGFSGARAKSREGESLCTTLRKEYEQWQKVGAAEFSRERCIKNVADLRVAHGLAAGVYLDLVGDDSAPACEDAVQNLANDIAAKITAAVAPLPKDTALKNALTAVLQRRSDIKNKVDTAGMEIGLFGKPKTKPEDQSIPGCEELARELKGYDSDDRALLSVARRLGYDRLYGLASQFENSATGGPWVHAGLSGYLSIVGGKFHPNGDDGQPDFSTKEAWTLALPGLSFDFAVMFPDKIVAVGAGITGGVDDSPVKICKRVAQGDFYTDDCSTDYLKRPVRHPRAYFSLLAALNPLAKLGDFAVGAQLSFVVATTTGKVDGEEREIFRDKSWRYKVSLPLFLTNAEAPWGLAAGIAPEMSRAIDSDDEEEIRILFFVGARPQQAPRK